MTAEGEGITPEIPAHHSRLLRIKKIREAAAKAISTRSRAQ